MYKLFYYAYILVLPILFSGMPWYLVLVGFLLMHFTAGLFLSCVFQPSHIMETSAFATPIKSEGKMRMEDSWAVHELGNTTNFAPKSRILSWFIGALNFQIEHHLFTGICHVHYPKIAPIVKSTAFAFGLPYHEQETFMKALLLHAKMLKLLGKEKFKYHNAMDHQTYAVIVGSGSYIPTRRIRNEDFLEHVFYDQDGIKLNKMNAEIIRQFGRITGIQERRYVTDDLVASDIAAFAGQDALVSSGIDGETLDYIIVAHNFGDIRADNRRSEFVPALASRVKHRLTIKNPSTIAYDLPFGCAGWLQGVIQADTYIRNGSAERVLVIGTETLSRISDPHDRDSMIYADGAGAVILEARRSDTPVGVLSHATKSYSAELAYVLRMGKSSNPAYSHDHLFLKMNGRKLYEYALKAVPQTMKECLDQAGLSVTEVDKVLIHQANEKMDEAILRNLFELYDLNSSPKDMMPMTISWLGNSSVATLPTLYDLMYKERLIDQVLQKGSVAVFASMGAGVNMNALAYKIPTA